MNFKKIAILPLLALVLVGCNQNKKENKNSDSISIVEPTGEEVTEEQFEAALKEAAKSFSNQSAIGFDVNKGHAEIKNKELYLGEDNKFYVDHDINAVLDKIALKANLENIDSEDINKDFLAEVHLSTGLAINGTTKDEKEGAKQGDVVNVNVAGDLFVDAYVVNADPFVSLPTSNQPLLDSLKATMTAAGIKEASMVDSIELPLNYHLINTKMDLTSIKSSLEGFVIDMFEDVEISEQDKMLLKKMSETEYCMYLERNADLVNKETVNEKEYVVGTEVTTAKALVTFDTKIGLTKAQITVDTKETETFAKELISKNEDLTTYSEEQLATTVSSNDVVAQAQVDFTYGDAAKTNIPLQELLSYQPIDIGMLIGSMLAGNKQ